VLGIEAVSAALLPVTSLFALLRSLLLLRALLLDRLIVRSLLRLLVGVVLPGQCDVLLSGCLRLSLLGTLLSSRFLLHVLPAGRFLLLLRRVVLDVSIWLLLNVLLRSRFLLLLLSALLSGRFLLVLLRVLLSGWPLLLLLALLFRGLCFSFRLFLFVAFLFLFRVGESGSSEK